MPFPARDGQQVTLSELLEPFLLVAAMPRCVSVVRRSFQNSFKLLAPWAIPRTQCQGAFLETREEYLEIGLLQILKALKLLQAHPEYRLVLDQVACVRPVLERCPEQSALAFQLGFPAQDD
jgi:hypothetical protein